MDFKELNVKRQSCRKYKENQAIDKKVICDLIDEANQAPSWKNSQTARYHCVTSSDLIEKIKEEALPEYNAKVSNNASAYIVCTYVKDISGFSNGEANNELANHWGTYDLALNNMTFILAAKNVGIDSLIMGLRDADKIKSILNIPEDEVIVSVLALGYAESLSKKPSRKSFEEISKFY